MPCGHRHHHNAAIPHLKAPLALGRAGSLPVEHGQRLQLAVLWQPHFTVPKKRSPKSPQPGTMYALPLSDRSTSPTSSWICGCAAMTFSMPVGAPTTETMMILCSGTPASLRTLMAANAVPPVASIGSTRMTRRLSISDGSLLKKSLASLVSSSRWIRIFPWGSAGICRLNSSAIASAARRMLTTHSSFAGSGISIPTYVAPSTGVVTVFGLHGSRQRASPKRRLDSFRAASTNSLFWVSLSRIVVNNDMV
mmetsp:Transcript_18834/g.38284  ORF Transcript_18834/g.38284 Transcript_18834/m.38284 type:complete len:251 (+) Transcript_18834:316-1068(+)